MKKKKKKTKSTDKKICILALYYHLYCEILPHKLNYHENLYTRIKQYLWAVTLSCQKTGKR